MPYISGTVRDDSGAPIARALRFYRRDTGDLLGAADSSGAEIPGDPHFANVSLLLHMDGADGSTTFTDSSATPNTVTAVGNAKISTAQGLWGGASGEINGAAGHLLVSNAQNFKLASGDFTIEFFARASQLPGVAALLANRPGKTSGWVMCVNDSGQLFLQGITGTPSYVITATGAISVGVWLHVAVVRSGSLTKIYVGGVEKASGSIGWPDYTADVFSIGYESNLAQYPFSGHMRELRITKGVARYTADFTPPVVAFPNTSSATPARPLGDYYFPTDHAGEVQVVCLDDATGALENDLILRAFAV